MAAYGLLKKQVDSPFVLNLLEEDVFYDGCKCSGECLMEDIENHLELWDDEET